MMIDIADEQTDCCPHCRQPLPISVAGIVNALREAEGMIVAETRQEQVRLTEIRRVLDVYGARAR